MKQTLYIEKFLKLTDLKGKRGILVLDAKDHFLNKIIEKIKEINKYQNKDIISFYGYEIEKQELIKELYAVDIFSPKKLIILKNLEAKDFKNKALNLSNVINIFFKEGPESNFLIIDFKDWKDITKVNGDIYEIKFYKTGKDKIVYWIIEELEQAGKKIDYASAEHLAEKFNIDVDILEKEIKKIKLSEIETITKEYIDKQSDFISTKIENNDFIDSIISRDRTKCFKQYLKMLKSGERPIDIFNIICYFFTLLKKDNIKLSRARQALVSKLNGKYSTERLDKIFEKILETDYKLKTSSHQTEILDQFILEIME